MKHPERLNHHNSTNRAKSLTLKAFLQLPATKPTGEDGDGRIIEKSTPQGKQSVIQGESVNAINVGVKHLKIVWTVPERC